MLDLKAVMWLENYLQVIIYFYFFVTVRNHMVCVGVINNA
jgi:hypothetical protein